MNRLIAHWLPVFARDLRTRFAIGLAVACCPACTNDVRPHIENSTAFEGWGFELLLPEGVSGSQDAQEFEIDFETYSFVKDGDEAAFLKAYAGGHPSFPTESENGKIKKTKIGPHPARSTSSVTSDGLHTGEVLVTIDDEWGDYIHFYYFDLPEDQKRVADLIISTVRKVSPDE